MDCVEQWYSVETPSGIKGFLLPVNPAEFSRNDEDCYAELGKLAELHGASIRTSPTRIGKPRISGAPVGPLCRQWRPVLCGEKSAHPKFPKPLPLSALTGMKVDRSIIERFFDTKARDFFLRYYGYYGQAFEEKNLDRVKGLTTRDRFAPAAAVRPWLYDTADGSCDNRCT